MALRFADPASEAYQYPLTIGRLLDASLITAGDEVIVYRDKLRLTYRELRTRIGRLASALASLGVEPGSVVAMMDVDSHRYLEAYFAVPMMGAVLQTVNVRLPIDQIDYTLKHAEADVILCHADFLPLIQPLLMGLHRVKKLVLISDDDEPAMPYYAQYEYEALLRISDPNYPFVDIDENALAATFYTTGTTGNPKGVYFSHRQIVLHAITTCVAAGAAVEHFFGFGDVYMPLTPMFHVQAWGFPYIATMLGMKQVYPGRYDAGLICRLRAEEGVSYSHCVPTVLQMVLTAAEDTDTDLTGWAMSIGGAALTHALWNEATSKGMNIRAGYGMSETGPTLTIARSPNFKANGADGDALVLAGVPIPLVAVRIVDEEMNDLPHDGVARGELVARAPWLTQSYTGNPEASGTLWRGGWLHTQDIATIDAKGRVAIVDRLKDVIKTGGEWISSLELENLIADVDGVAAVAVIGVPDPRWSERPLAVIVANEGAVPTLDQVNAAIAVAINAGAITRYAKLDRIELVDALPRTSVGKIDKKLLRAQLSGARSADREAAQ